MCISTSQNCTVFGGMTLYLQWMPQLQFLKMWMEPNFSQITSNKTASHNLNFQCFHYMCFFCCLQRYCYLWNYMLYNTVIWQSSTTLPVTNPSVYRKNWHCWQRQLVLSNVVTELQLNVLQLCFWLEESRIIS